MTNSNHEQPMTMRMCNDRHEEVTKSINDRVRYAIFWVTVTAFTTFAASSIAVYASTENRMSRLETQNEQLMKLPDKVERIWQAVNRIEAIQEMERGHR